MDKVGHALVLSAAVQKQLEGLHVSLIVIYQTLHDRSHCFSSGLGQLKRFMILLEVQKETQCLFIT